MRIVLDSLRRDLRYALRTFVRSPGFSLVALATIAIGVGANTAIFSIVNAVLLKPLPYPRADELVLVSQSNRQTKQTLGDATPANFLDWRVRNHTFTGMAAFKSESLIISSSGEPERLDGAMVNANFFDVLEVKPAIGRGFVAADEQPGAPRVAVLTDGLWRRRFGAPTSSVKMRGSTTKRQPSSASCRPASSTPIRRNSGYRRTGVSLMIRCSDRRRIHPPSARMDTSWSSDD